MRPKATTNIGGKRSGLAGLPPMTASNTDPSQSLSLGAKPKPLRSRALASKRTRLIGPITRPSSAPPRPAVGRGARGFGPSAARQPVIRGGGQIRIPRVNVDLSGVGRGLNNLGRDFGDLFSHNPVDQLYRSVGDRIKNASRR